MKDMLTIKVIMFSAVAVAAVAMTTITTFDIFAQNQSSLWDQLVNDCWNNNVTACKALEGNSTAAYPPQVELNGSS
jgi:hypothetical protein